MDLPGYAYVVMLLLTLPALWAAFGLVRVVRMAIHARQLGKRWRGRRLQSGRECWTLVSAEGKSLERIRKTPNGLWATEWGREFIDLTQAARWVESKHPDLKQ